MLHFPHKEIQIEEEKKQEKKRWLRYSSSCPHRIQVKSTNIPCLLSTSLLGSLPKVANQRIKA